VRPFWRPVRGIPADGSQVKELGHGLYELWSRCDNCDWSGSALRFVIGRRGELDGWFCDTCTGDERFLEELLAHGWALA
jgi:hypothetical protein